MREGEPKNEEENITPTEVATQEDGLPSYLKMYEISGQDPITEHSFNRYKKDKNQDAAIEDIVRNPRNPVATEQVKGQQVEQVYTGSKDPEYLFFNKVKFAPIEEQSSIVKSALENDDINIQKMGANNIRIVPEKDRLELQNIVLKKVKKGLDNPDVEIQKISAGMIGGTPEKEISSLIKLGLNISQVEVQKEAIMAIGAAPEEEKTSLLEFALKNPNLEIQKFALSKCYYVGYERISLLSIGLNSPHPEVQKAAVDAIRSVVPEEERAELIKLGLNSSNPEVQKMAVGFMGSGMSKKDRRELLDLIKEKGLTGEFIRPPTLYAPEFKIGNNEKEIDDVSFSRNEFRKTGSGITLIGGELKDKTVIRHIHPKAFIAWQKLYEDHNIWKEAGFDYVPVEQIQSYKLNKENSVDVFTGVLDLALGQWLGKTDKIFERELLDQRDKIIQVVNLLKIRHGHMHDNNFCLRFFRDKDGKVDLNRVPRVYLIDFDQAISPAK